MIHGQCRLQASPKSHRKSDQNANKLGNARLDLESRSQLGHYLRSDPRFESLRDDSQFQAPAREGDVQPETARLSQHSPELRSVQRALANQHMQRVWPPSPASVADTRCGLERAGLSQVIVYPNVHLVEQPDRWDPAVCFEGFARGVFRGLLERRRPAVYSSIY